MGSNRGPLVCVAVMSTWFSLASGGAAPAALLPEGQLLLRWVQFPPSTYPRSFFLYFPNPAQFLLHSQQFLRSLGP